MGIGSSGGRKGGKEMRCREILESDSRRQREGDKEEAEGEEEKEKELMRWREEEVQLVQG